MAKVKTNFVCQNCGTKSPQWLGKCPSCGEWNTFVEEVETKTKAPQFSNKHLYNTENITTEPKPIQDIEPNDIQRIVLNDKEFNRVLGGGFVPGALVLIGGEPGIGKSTLLLQTALKHKDLKVLYVSGEESEQQIRLHADRVGINNENCFVLNATNLTEIIVHAKNIKPDFIVIDSIQTIYSDKLESFPGTVSQIRECTAGINEFAKNLKIPTCIIGHITKDGSIAGPKLLEHMVDTVLQFEGDKNYQFRLLRSIKNRFGSTSELGIYEMQANGLKEVPNPSDILMSQSTDNFNGVSIAATLEGMRPLLVEIQALVSTAVYGNPQRTTTGFDTKRLNMLLAVLEKRCGFKLAAKDVFLNITGGLKVNDPAIDLAVITAILSSNEDIEIPKTICFAGEIGLSGEIRPVSRLEQRISEAEKIGFKQIFVGHKKQQITKKFNHIQVFPVKRIENVFEQLFG